MKTSPATTEPATRPATTAHEANMRDADENIAYLVKILKLPHGPAPKNERDAIRRISELWIALEKRNSKVAEGRT